MGGMLAAALLGAWAATAGAQPAAATAEPPCVGLVLGGGGARGIAHVGVLKVLERERIPVCAIAGTSMGAIVGGLYAAGYDAEELERLLSSIDWADMFVDSPPRAQLPMERKQEDFRHLLDLEIGYRDGRLSVPAGLVRGQKLMLLLRRLTLSTWRAEDFDDLPIRFRAVAADIVTGRKKVFAEVPGAFAPVRVGEQLLVDGGMAENVPVEEVRAMGAQPMVVVDVGSQLLKEDALTNPAVVLDQVITALMGEKTARSLATLADQDVLLQPDLGDITAADFHRAAAAVAIGERAAEAQLSKLRALALPAADYAALRARQRHRAFDPGLLAFLDVEPGQTPSATRRVAWATVPLVGKPFEISAVERAVGAAYGDGRFQTIDYRLLERDGRAGLVVQPRQKPWDASGRVGLQLDDDFNGRSDYLLSAELVFNDVNRIGGKWRNLIQLGRITGLRSELYQPFGARGAFYLRPALVVRGESLPLWQQGNQLAEYRLLRREFDFGLGYSPQPAWRMELALVGGRDSARLDVGGAGLVQAGSESFAGLRAGATWDTLDSVDFPTRGGRVDVELLSLHPWAGTRADGEVARASLDWAVAWKRYHLLLGTRLASALEDDAGGLRSQTFLGGFLNLSGYAERSLVGSQAALARAVFYRRTGDTSRLFSLPLYVGASVEAGNVWNARSEFGRGSAVVAGSLFGGLDTPLGPVFLGFGRNSSGADSWYLSFGSMLRQEPR